MAIYRPAMTGDRPELLEHVGDRSTVLVLAPQRSTADGQACIDLLTGRKPEDSNVLSVTVSETPDERLALWQREVGDRLPKRATVVDAGSGAPVDSQVAASAEFPSLSVDALPADADLVDIGMSIARHLSAWKSNQESTFLCLHSLTTLLGSFERERVISFVQSLNALCDCVGVRAHHHVDPSSHSEETIEAFRPQYEAVVDHVPDHGWIVGGDEGAAESPSTRHSPASANDLGEPASDRSSVVSLPYSLDTVLDVISVARRRSLLYYLRDRGGDTAVPLEELVDGVRARERAVADRRSRSDADEVRLSLVHTHLPKLDEAGIVDFDPDAGVLEYRENPALESCLDYVEMLESA